MKYTIGVILLSVLSACSRQDNQTQQLQAQIDSLQQKLDNSYRPGFGELMSSVQVHHNKLWFAGINGNWKLADFEINEINESLNDIKAYCTDRPETRSVGMIDESLQLVSNAIRQTNSGAFRDSYTMLTNACNKCHQATQHGFNLVTVPTTPPFSNQSFKPVP